MSKKAAIKTITSGYASNTQLNFNFEAINDQLDNTLSLDGSTPNAMGGDLDLDSNDLLNVGAADVDSLTVAGVIVTDATYVPDWKGPWVTSTAYVINDLVNEAGNSYICLIAHTSGTFSTDLTAVKWEIFAQKGAAGAGTGDMLAANNLSDVANVATSRSNLGLGDVAVQNKASIDITGGTVVGITDLVIADGGTGSSTASAAFTALKQSATTSDTGVVEKATSVEGTTPVADKYPDTIVVEEMIKTHGALTEETKQATTSGTAFDFTSIPAGTREIMVCFNNVSLSGSDDLLIQLGDSGGIETTGYLSATANASSFTSFTNGLGIGGAGGTLNFSGVMVLVLMDSANNTWVESTGVGRTGNQGEAGGGVKSLSAELTQLRLTRSGSNTFDAGEVNILYR